jgi:hypothetical protein
VHPVRRLRGLRGGQCRGGRGFHRQVGRCMSATDR